MRRCAVLALALCAAALAAAAAAPPDAAPPTPAPRTAYVTALLNNSEGFLYLAETLLYSLRATGTAHDVYILLTPVIAPITRVRLRAHGYRLIDIPLLTPVPFPERCAGAVKQDGVSVFNKIYMWGLTQFDKIVFLDTDIVVQGNIDDLFDYPGVPFSAAPDLGSGELFNTGVVVYEPSKALMHELLDKVYTLEGYDCTDQGFLNAVFREHWASVPAERRLPRTYNFMSNPVTSEPPPRESWEASIADMRVVHFAGFKPWGNLPDFLDQKSDWFRFLHQLFYRVFPMTVNIPPERWAALAIDQALYDLLPPRIQSMGVLQPEIAAECPLHTFDLGSLEHRVVTEHSVPCAHRLLMLAPDLGGAWVLLAQHSKQMRPRKAMHLLRYAIEPRLPHPRAFQSSIPLDRNVALRELVRVAQSQGDLEHARDYAVLALLMLPDASWPAEQLVRLVE